MTDMTEKQIQDLIKFDSKYKVKGIEVAPVCIARSQHNGYFYKFNVIVKRLDYSSTHYSYPWEWFIKNATLVLE